MQQQRLDRPLSKLMFLVDKYPLALREDMTPTPKGFERPKTAHFTLTPKKPTTATSSLMIESKSIRVVPLTPKERPRIEERHTPNQSPTFQNRTNFSKRQRIEKLSINPPNRVVKLSKSQLDFLRGVQTPKSASDKVFPSSDFCVNGRGVLPSISEFNNNKNASSYPRSTTSIVSRNNLDTSQDQNNSRILDSLQRSPLNSPKMRAKDIQTEESFLKSLISEADEREEIGERKPSKPFEKDRLPSIKDWDHNYAPIYQRLELELNRKSPTSPKLEKPNLKKRDNVSELSSSSIRMNSLNLSESSQHITPRSSFRTSNLGFLKTPENKVAKQVTFDFGTEKVFFYSSN
mgnify:FL=1